MTALLPRLFGDVSEWLDMDFPGRFTHLIRVEDSLSEQEYAAFGLGRPEFDVLATLRRSGARLSPGRLASAMMLSSGGTTARLDH